VDLKRRRGEARGEGRRSNLTRVCPRGGSNQLSILTAELVAALDAGPLALWSKSIRLQMMRHGLRA
jgi:hypothetical protein